MIFCLNFSRSFARICPPDALGCPPHFTSFRFFVVASNNMLTPIFSVWSLAEILTYFPFGDKKRWIFPGYFLVMMLISGLLIGNLGL